MMVCTTHTTAREMKIAAAKEQELIGYGYSYGDVTRLSGEGLLICHDWLGGSNSPKNHPHIWNPSVVGPQLSRNLEQGVNFRYNIAPYRYALYFIRAASI